MNCKDKLFHHPQFDVNVKKENKELKEIIKKKPKIRDPYFNHSKEKKIRYSPNQSKIEDKQKFILAVKRYLSCFIQWLCKIVDLDIYIDKDYVFHSDFPFFRKIFDTMDRHKTIKQMVSCKLASKLNSVIGCFIDEFFFIINSLTSIACLHYLCKHGYLYAKGQFSFFRATLYIELKRQCNESIF